MGDHRSRSSDDVEVPPPAPGRLATLRAGARRRTRSLPWSDGSIFIVSIVMVMVLAPVWMDATALREFTGAGATASPGVAPSSPRTGNSGVPQLSIPPIGQTLATIVVRDTFARFEEGGWGTADLGGSYTALDQVEDLAVRGGTGSFVLATAGAERALFLSDVSIRDADVAFSVALDTLPADGAMHVYAAVRRTPTGVAYRPKIFVTPTGALYAHAGVLLIDGERSLGRSALIPGLTVTGGTVIHFRTTVSGSDPTIIRVRAWASGEEEPEYWNFGAIDWTGSLQGVGSIGLAAYLGVRHPGGPVRVAFDDLTVTTTDLPGGSQ